MEQQGDKYVSYADAIPQKQGLYDPEYEKDACGVGFIVQIKGISSHKIVSDARGILCKMTHRGATGADVRDGDGAGIMTSMPHEFFQEEAFKLKISLPNLGEYAIGNVFFNPELYEQQKLVFEDTASSLNLKILSWRVVPVDNTILGPASKSKEPKIRQPIITLNRSGAFDKDYFEKQLYLLKKISTNKISLSDWFYVCSLSTQTIIYKGQLTTAQVYDYFLDLGNSSYKAKFALVHSRFSTNTFPSWNRAQPLRYLAHNGEINTLRGNKNWMRTREGVIKSNYFSQEELEALFPIIEGGVSDSATFDNVLEFLLVNKHLSLPAIMMMMVPEAWQNNELMNLKKKSFYQWAACLMEPWDGPALFTFSDGRYCGACLDRNGLRPCRYYITKDDRMILASEVGTISLDPSIVLRKGRLQPGRMLLVDTEEGHIVSDNDLKRSVSEKRSFDIWIKEQMLSLREIHSRNNNKIEIETTNLSEDPRMKAFGFSLEQLNMLLLPMIKDGKESLGSMGFDTPLACLSKQPRSIYEYFRQLFAQVTNPPIDPIREKMVMSLECYVGPEGNILELDPIQCRRLRLESPILSIQELDTIKHINNFADDWKVAIIDTVFDKELQSKGYLVALDQICAQTSKAIKGGVKIVILSDAKIGPTKVPLSSLIAVAGVHQYLIKKKQRSKVALFVETGEAREVHHHCVLLGYGADAICPYLAFESIISFKAQRVIDDSITLEKLIENYIKASNDGILKVMSKMGISTLQSYKGAQVFEALGLNHDVIEKCFHGTTSRIKGVNFDILTNDALKLHESAYPSRPIQEMAQLYELGEYHWRKGGERHINEPEAVSSLQDAVRNKNLSSYEKYSMESYQSIKDCTLRGLLDFNYEMSKPVDIDEVESWTSIVKRFVTGAMSYGSISYESHIALAVAMNKLGAKSNTGEGGEDPERSETMVDGVSLRSSIKQVASGRFGVTSFYLSDADELQIKMAQGAKPGEGGELPGHKVSEDIAKTRKSTAGVGLISPPPHHDIYSIEDLKQLIYDLKCSNPRSRVSIKLVSQIGVGIVASGVAKAKADHILISGHDGGTGASRWTGIKYAGLPWELGLAETHQTLVLNDLRGRVVLQTDGQIKTGRDVAIACLLGAEEFGFATTPLIALGCIMMRKCHLNTCPVGIATQDPELRKKFVGEPEHVINFFYYVCNELREIMAKLGFRTIEEMVGKSDYLRTLNDDTNSKASLVDLSHLLAPAYKLRPGVATHCVKKQDHKIHTRLDNKFIFDSESAFLNKTKTIIETEVANIDRAIGTTLSYHISKRFGEKGLPDDTIIIKGRGSAGQSYGAFLARGVTLELEGDANDYVGKGLSGGKIIIYPPKASLFKSEENIIVGNVCLYGATSGVAYFRGIAAERFCVRNSGALAVVEGVGDHGCEYMTGGRVVILGNVGKNFAAGMSGGIAYILNSNREFELKCNKEMVELEPVTEEEEIEFLRKTIKDYYDCTQSQVAKQILESYKYYLSLFVKVIPEDYKKALLAKEQQSKALPDSTNSKKSVSTKEPSVTDIEDVFEDHERLQKKLSKIDKIKGFMKYERKTDKYRSEKERVHDFEEINNRLNKAQLKVQTARCMDCGVPFCQSDFGCPIGNIIPKWNELVYQGDYKNAFKRLMLTNNFPEFTGRVCPAPCEGACVLGINSDPVAIKSIECAIIDHAFKEGWITPQKPRIRTGKKVCVIGSGPCGLAAADMLNKVGHLVTVYESADQIGGLLMYGIPNMKLDKAIVKRRVDLLSQEGIIFKTNMNVGVNVDALEILNAHDAMLLALGSTIPRDLNIKNRHLKGIHFSMDLLTENTKNLLTSSVENNTIQVKDKNVVVIGGGDTGCDCIGTSIRLGAKSITNFELLTKPEVTRDPKSNPWPQFPRLFKLDYGHNEVFVNSEKDPREFCILTTEFVPSPEDPERIGGLKTVNVEWSKDEKGNWLMKQIEGSERFFLADVVLLAMGFVGPNQTLIDNLGINKTKTNTVNATEKDYKSNNKKVFAAGDCRRGQSLVVWAINEGRQAARSIDLELMGSTSLPKSGGVVEFDIKSSDLTIAQLPDEVSPAFKKFSNY